MTKDEAELLAAKIQSARDGVFNNMKLSSASLEMTVHRAATGKDEHYGLVSYYNRNPIKHYYINFKIWLRGKYRQWQQ